MNNYLHPHLYYAKRAELGGIFKNVKILTKRTLDPWPAKLKTFCQKTEKFH